MAADAVAVVSEFPETIDLLYLDPDGDRKRSIYLAVLQAAYQKLAPGSLVLAHNSQNGGSQLTPYLEFVRDPAHFRASMNVLVDSEGLEVSLR